MLWKCWTQYASKFGKLSSGHRTGKGQFSFQSQWNTRQRMLKLPHNCTHLSPVQFSSVAQSCPTLCNTMNCSMPGLPVHHQLPEFIQTQVPFSHLILCRPLLLLPSIFPIIRVFSNESALCIRWPKYWSFSFNISPSSEHPGLIFFRMDWLDLLGVQGTLKSLLQHNSSKEWILWHSAFFILVLNVLIFFFFFLLQKGTEGNLYWRT